MATEDAVSEVAGGGGEAKVLSALKSKEVLIPAALTAATALAASKGPDLMKMVSGHSQEEAEKLGQRAAEGAKNSITNGGGGGGLMGKAVKKAVGKSGGGGGGKKTRRLPIQRWTDVAVPVDQAYEAWTKFDDFPKFMHRVLTVEQNEKQKDRIAWQEKIWFSKREWEGRITDRRKNELIAWKTTKGAQHKGVVTFHPISDRLTRVMVDMEFEPTGMIEKMGSGLRFVKRAVQADLARFKAFVELADAKGIDYRPNSKNEEDDDKNKKDDNKNESDDSNDGADDPSSRERDENADEEREEREKRRQERRERTKAD